MQSRKPVRLLTFILSALLLTGTLAWAACGGSGTETSTTHATSAPSAVASPGAAVGGASPTATPTTPAQLADAFAAAAGTPTAGLFAEDAVLQDRSYGARKVGAQAIHDYQDFWSGVGTFEERSPLVGSDGFAVESVFAGFEYSVDVLRVRDGKIVADYVYYCDLQQGPEQHEPTALTAAPATGDTEAASGAVAKAYMAALRALDPARLGALYAQKVVYMDTARDADYKGPSAVTAAHARMFALKGVRFQANGVVDGPGWAAVMWKRTDREGGKPLLDTADVPAKFLRWGKRPTIHGVSILEIRGGKIARETIYSDHLRTRY